MKSAVSFKSFREFGIAVKNGDVKLKLKQPVKIKEEKHERTELSHMR